MADSAKRELQRSAPAKPPPPADERRRTVADALRALASEPSKPAYSMIVLSGLVSAGEWLALALAGIIPYHIHVVANIGPQPLYTAISASMAICAIAIFHSLRVYTPRAFRHPLRPLIHMAWAWTILVLAVITTTFFLKADQYVSRVWMAAWFGSGIALLVMLRTVLAGVFAALARAGRLQRRVVMVGGGELAGQALRNLRRADPMEIRVLGVFDDRSDSRSPDSVEGFPKLGDVDDLVDLARISRIDLVVFVLPITAEQRILTMLSKLCVLPVDIRLAAHANRLRFRPRSYSYVGELPLLDILDKPIAHWDVVIKLLFDKIVGSLALIALSPVLALTALAIRLESRGPVLFKQKRYGFNNELIEIYKFRSMYADQLDASASTLVTRNDPRVTHVGRFIRKTSIDELPQLFNVVFKGDLSLVGPRPHAMHAKAANRQYDDVVDGYFARHRVKPGLTGWAQINGWRGQTDTPEKIQCRVEHDLHYIENWSILFDLRILAMTPMSLIKATNAF
jgi:Undecaprenyl-phosphate glucose phosphotransferase